MIPFSPFLLRAILWSILVPLASTTVLVRALPHLTTSITLLAYALCLPFAYFLSTQWSLIVQRYRARCFAAVAIPCVRGKKPLNLDIMFLWLATSKSEYIGEGMIANLTSQYGPTINTRVLGEDSTITVDPVVSAQVLGSKFESFPKGDKFAERVRGFLGEGVFAADGPIWKMVSGRKQCQFLARNH